MDIMPVTKIKAKWDEGNLVFLDNSTNELLRLNADDKEVLINGEYKVRKIAKVALKSADTAGGVLSWVNPEDGDIIITRLLVNITTAASAACTLNFGTTSTSATTASDNLIDGLDVNTATGLFDNITDKGDNGRSKQLLAKGKWLTGSKATGAAAGLAGYAYIEYVVV
jgi:hypothetical protein